MNFINAQVFDTPKLSTSVYNRQAFFSANTLLPGAKASRIHGQMSRVHGVKKTEK